MEDMLASQDDMHKLKPVTALSVDAGGGGDRISI